MSLLEKFLIIFESDASEVDRGTKQAKKSTDELRRSLTSVDLLTGKLGEKFNGLLTRATGMFAAYLSARAIISSFSNAIDYADRLGEIAESLDVNIETLSAYSDAVKKAGGTQEGFVATVTAMTAALADVATKGKSRLSPFFDELRIKVTDSQGKARKFLDLLPEIATAFEKISKEESLGLGQKMGLDPGTIMLLQKGNKEVVAFLQKQRELGVITKGNAALAAKFKDTWDDLVHVFRSVFSAISMVVLPPLTWLSDKLIKLILFLKNNEHFATGLFIGIASIISGILIPAIIRLGVTAAIAFAPFYIIGAVLLGIATIFGLIYDDIQNFLAGNKSLTGELIKKWPIIGNIITGVWSALKALACVATELFSAKTLSKIVDGAINAWNLFKDAISLGIDKLFEAVPALKSVWDVIAKSITFALDILMGAIDAVAAGYNKVKEFFGGKSSIDATMNSTNKIVGSANQSPLNSRSLSSISSASTAISRNVTTQIENLNIQTQSDRPEELARAVTKELTNEMRQASNTFSSGVAI